MSIFRGCLSIVKYNHSVYFTDKNEIEKKIDNNKNENDDENKDDDSRVPDFELKSPSVTTSDPISLNLDKEQALAISGAGFSFVFSAPASRNESSAKKGSFKNSNTEQKSENRDLQQGITNRMYFHIDCLPIFFCSVFFVCLLIGIYFHSHFHFCFLLFNIAVCLSMHDDRE